MYFEMREAQPNDLPFLQAMLHAAMYWRPGVEHPRAGEGLYTPELTKLLEGWPRPGDLAIIACAEDSTPLGAAWFRFWTEDNHSYGFVSEAIPELAIGVIEPYRGLGLGRELLRTLQGAAIAHDIPQISLSVERDNPALNLYETEGFVTVGTVGNALTMVWPAL